MTNDETTFRGPESVPFPTDAESIALILRAFVGLLYERVNGGDGDPEEGGHADCDYVLPDGTTSGLSFDRVVCALLRHGQPQPDDLEDMHKEIAQVTLALLQAIES